MILYFVRHAEPDYTKKNDNERNLTSEGLLQAETIELVFRKENIGAIYSSPYLRAVQTLLPLADKKKLHIQIIDNLKERVSANYVVPKNEFKDFGEKQWRDHFFHFEGGESIAMVGTRYLEVVRQITNKQNEKESIVIGCHITGLCALLAKFNIINNYSEFKNYSDRKPWIVKFVCTGTKINKCIIYSSISKNPSESYLKKAVEAEFNIKQKL